MGCRARRSRVIERSGDLPCPCSASIVRAAVKTKPSAALNLSRRSESDLRPIRGLPDGNSGPRT
jgi:hypothetical protein